MFHLVANLSFIIWRKGCVEIHFHFGNQRPDARKQSGVDRTHMLGMNTHVVRREGQEHQPSWDVDKLLFGTDIFQSFSSFGEFSRHAANRVRGKAPPGPSGLHAIAGEDILFNSMSSFGEIFFAARRALAKADTRIVRSHKFVCSAWRRRKFAGARSLNSRGDFAFDIFDILKDESQEKCRVFEFKN